MPIAEQLNQILNRKDLLRYLVSSELKARYRNKALGFLWAILDPLMLMLIYVVLVSVIFQRGGPQFPILLFSTLIAWRWFTHATLTSAKTLYSNARIIQSVSFPNAILPLSRVLISFVNFCMGFVVLIPLLFIFKASFSIQLIWLPVLMLLLFGFTTGVSMVVSVIGVYFRDLQNILEFSIRFFFYLSPALYSVSDLPEKYQTAYLLINPFASLFESLKNVLVHGLPPSPYLFVFVIYTILFLIWGFHLFENKNTLAKEL